ncbi:MAG: FapA family protein [Planctomycetota bacterium]
MGQDTVNKATGVPDSQVDPSKRVHLHLSKNKVLLMLDCYVLSDEIDDIVEEVLDEMDSLQIPDCPDNNVLKEKILQGAQNNPNLKSFVIMEGQQPTLSRNGRIRWKGPYFDKGFIKDDTGAVDYRRRAAQTSVTAGEMLGFLIPPKRGEDGVDLFGKVVSANEPAPCRIRAGNNVRFDEQKGAYYALKNGRIRYMDKVLSVDEVYRVEGDVDIETGNITHNGAVVVEGDVLEGSEIKAEGSIEIKGLLEASRVETNGDLIVSGGITRISDSQLNVAGSVNAKFIIESDLRAGGDVIVEREIVNSKIKSRGAIMIPGGRIVGGNLTALKGVVVGQLGSRASVPSITTAGVDYTLVKGLMPLQKEIQKLRKKMVRDLKGPTDTMLARRDSLNEEQIKELNWMLNEIAQIQEKIWDLKREMKKASLISKRQAKEHVLVKKILFPNIEIFLGKEKLYIDGEYRGPVNVVMEEDKVVIR